MVMRVLPEATSMTTVKGAVLARCLILLTVGGLVCSWRLLLTRDFEKDDKVVSLGYRVLISPRGYKLAARQWAGLTNDLHLTNDKRVLIFQA
jgi:hypothetical protein